MRALNVNELELVSGGLAGWDSTDYNSAMGDIPYDHDVPIEQISRLLIIAKASMAQYAAAAAASNQSDAVDLDHDGLDDRDGAIIVEGAKLPEGYRWAPGEMGDQYLIRPDGSLAFTPQYAQQVCDNFFRLSEGINDTNNQILAVSTLLGYPTNSTTLSVPTYFLGAIAGGSLALQQYFAGNPPPYCNNDGTISYDPTINYPDSNQP